MNFFFFFFLPPTVERRRPKDNNKARASATLQTLSAPGKRKKSHRDCFFLFFVALDLVLVVVSEKQERRRALPLRSRRKRPVLGGRAGRGGLREGPGGRRGVSPARGAGFRPRRLGRAALRQGREGRRALSRPRGPLPAAAAAASAAALLSFPPPRRRGPRRRGGGRRRIPARALQAGPAEGRDAAVSQERPWRRVLPEGRRRRTLRRRVGWRRGRTTLPAEEGVRRGVPGGEQERGRAHTVEPPARGPRGRGAVRLFQGLGREHGLPEGVRLSRGVQGVRPMRVSSRRGVSPGGRLSRAALLRCRAGVGAARRRSWRTAASSSSSRRFARRRGRRGGGEKGRESRSSGTDPDGSDLGCGDRPPPEGDEDGVVDFETAWLVVDSATED